MLYLHDNYNTGRISIYVSKTHGESSSPSVIETQEHCVPDMNEGGDIEESSPDIELITNLIE